MTLFSFSFFLPFQTAKPSSQKIRGLEKGLKTAQIPTFQAHAYGGGGPNNGINRFLSFNDLACFA